MIRNVLAIYLFVRIMFCSVFAGGTEVHIKYGEYYKSNARYLHKVWGMEYCLDYTGPSDPKKQWLFAKQNMAQYVSKAADDELKHFIDKYKEKNLLVVCLKLYDSKDYQQEIDRIVKKYCKECE